MPSRRAVSARRLPVRSSARRRSQASTRAIVSRKVSPSRTTASTGASTWRRRSERREAGIASAAYYVVPLHLQPALAHLGWQPGSLPETERAAAENLALPMWGGIGADVQERVVETVLATAGVAAAG